MPACRRIVVVLCLAMMVPVAGLAQSTQARRPVKPKFAALYKSGKAIQAAIKVGVNKIQFMQLLTEFTTNVEIARDDVSGPTETKVLEEYETAGQSLAYIVDCCWTVEAGERARLFGKMLGVANHLLENAHRASRGEKPLPMPEELQAPDPK